MPWCDTPEDLCLDKLSEAYFGNEGLGKTILGTKSNVKKFKKTHIEDYKKRFYNADNVVLSFAGKITLSHAEKLVEKYFLPFIKSYKSDCVDINSNVNLSGRKYAVKDIEQTHFALGFKGVKYDDKESDALSLINIILGMGMSSRLFQRVREELGLCYSIYSYPSCYRNTGTIIVYAGVNNESFEAAFCAVKDVLKEIKCGITDKEFERGKAQVLSSFAFGEESTSSQMILYGKYLLFTGKVFDPKAKMKKINSITKSEVDGLLRDLDFENFSAAAVSKKGIKLQF